MASGSSSRLACWLNFITRPWSGGTVAQTEGEDDRGRDDHREAEVKKTGPERVSPVLEPVK